MTFLFLLPHSPQFPLPLLPFRLVVLGLLELLLCLLHHRKRVIRGDSILLALFTFWIWSTPNIFALARNILRPHVFARFIPRILFQSVLACCVCKLHTELFLLFLLAPPLCGIIFCSLCYILLSS